MEQLVEHERTAFAMLHGSAAAVPNTSRGADDFEAVFFREAPALFQHRYKALPRILTATVRNWIEFNAEFFARLESDRTLIEQRLRCGKILPRIVSLEQNVSDKHSHGRSVIILHFEDGSALVYKPRSLAGDLLLGELFSRGLGSQSLLDHKSPAVIDRGTYGWAEHIAPARLPNKAAARRYYERCGMLLFSLYGLNGTDAHQHNLIAHGEYPVLVDLETVMHQDFTDSGTGYSREGQVMASVFRTGMLPQWRTDKDGQPRQMGGLTPETPHAIRHVPVPPGGEPANPSAHLADILRGFRKLYRHTMAQRGEWLWKEIDTLRMRSLATRFGFPGTQAYTELRRRTLRPQSLASGIDRGIALEFLAYLFLFRNATSRALPTEILRHELVALEGGDVPLFHARLASRSLYLGDRLIIRRFFSKSVLRLVRERLDALSESDLAIQEDVIRASFSLQEIEFDDFGQFKPTAHFTVRKSRYVSKTSQTAQPASSDECLRLAERIGDYLLGKSFRDRDGSIDWIVPKLNRLSRVYSLSNVDHSLFQGRAGIGLFFAALAHKSGRSRFHDAALRILQPTVTDVRERRSYTFSSGGIGAIDGGFGLVYSLATAGRLLGDEPLVEIALASLRHVDRDLLWKDEALDIVGGCAGALLVLCSLRQHFGEFDAWHLAQPCVENLLRRRRPAGRGCAWPTLDRRLLTGLSHGASGIALALARKCAFEPENEHIEAVRGAIRYERGSYRVDARNWPDLRYDRLRFGLGWSHGAPGIGMARLGMSHLAIRGLDEDLERALIAIRQFRGQIFDYVVSGRASHVAFLSALHRRGTFRGAASTLRRVTEAMISQAREGGAFRLPVKPSEL